MSATLLFDHPSVGSISSYVASNLLDIEAAAATYSSASAVKVADAREYMQDEGPPVLVSSPIDGVARIAYNRPKNNNAFDAAISSALITVLATLNEDLRTFAIVITGRGSYFCTAAKFDEMLRPTHPMELHSTLSVGT